MAVLLVAEHDNKSLKDATAKALSAAIALGGPVDILVAGQNAKGVADAAAKLKGVSKVLLADDAQYAHQLAENMASLIIELAGKYDAVLSPASTSGKNFMPRVAAALDVAQISEVGYVHAADLCRQRDAAGAGSSRREEGDHRPLHDVQSGGSDRFGTGRDNRCSQEPRHLGVRA
jgi:electron transfer flavoprotein alpha subunit